MRQRIFTAGALLWLLLVGLLPTVASAADRAVCFGEIEGIINPAVADYVDRAVQSAATSNCSTLILTLNTPGGLTSSTWQIGEDLLNADVPTVVYIAPQGAGAGSAGVFVTYAAHIAAMAPNTNIGAAHPVASGGADIGDDLRDKITNDAVARITNWALAHGRNADWAEQAVRQSVSIGSSQALDLNVVNLIARDRDDLLQQLDGRTVTLANGQTSVLETAGMPTRSINMSLIESALHWLGDPTIATLLLSLGAMAIYFELAVPGVGVSGVLGVISIALGLYGLSVLPINTVGAGLLILSLVLFAVDVFATKHGALTFGGIATFVVGALILIDAQAAPGVEVSRGVIIGLALAFALVVGLVAAVLARTHNIKPATGQESLIGQVAPVRTTIAPEGTIFVQGALWKARSQDRFDVGDVVEIVAVDGLTLVVRRPQALPA